MSQALRLEEALELKRRGPDPPRSHTKVSRASVSAGWIPTSSVPECEDAFAGALDSVSTLVAGFSVCGDGDSHQGVSFSGEVQESLESSGMAWFSPQLRRKRLKACSRSRSCLQHRFVVHIAHRTFTPRESEASFQARKHRATCDSRLSIQLPEFQHPVIFAE